MNCSLLVVIEREKNKRKGKACFIFVLNCLVWFQEEWRKSRIMKELMPYDTIPHETIVAREDV